MEGHLRRKSFGRLHFRFASRAYINPVQCQTATARPIFLASAAKSEHNESVVIISTPHIAQSCRASRHEGVIYLCCCPLSRVLSTHRFKQRFLLRLRGGGAFFAMGDLRAHPWNGPHGSVDLHQSSQVFLQRVHNVSEKIVTTVDDDIDRWETFHQ